MPQIQPKVEDYLIRPLALLVADCLVAFAAGVQKFFVRLDVCTGRSFRQLCAMIHPLHSYQDVRASLLFLLYYLGAVITAIVHVFTCSLIVAFSTFGTLHSTTID